MSRQVRKWEVMLQTYFIVTVFMECQYLFVSDCTEQVSNADTNSILKHRIWF